MAGVKVQELGLRFVRVCAEQYWGTCMFPVLFVIGILWSLFCHKKQTARIFLCYAVFLGLTVYNPLFVKYIIPKMNFEDEYYRFFWILPVIPGVAYYAVRIISSGKKKYQRMIAAVIAVAVIMLTGSPMQGIVRNYAMAENLYKVPNDLRAVCSIIHEDSESENPRVVFDIGLNFVARQYDASILLVLNRDAVLYRAGSQVIKMNPEKISYQRQKAIMDVVYYSEDVDMDVFREALIARKTDYLVVPVTNLKHDYIKACGCEAIAQTEERVVYRFDWKEYQ
ncbi:MAG: hypothetical protein SOY73_13800 [Blautia sp.]|nr:hypothetical protein [Blautia sp.]MDY4000138.1 hypothetical protein [Blautia sp.]